MLVVVFSHGGALGASKEVHELLLGEVHVIVSVRVTKLRWIPSVILVPRVRAKVETVCPRLQLEVRD